MKIEEPQECARRSAKSATFYGRVHFEDMESESTIDEVWDDEDTLYTLPEDTITRAIVHVSLAQQCVEIET